MRTGKTGQASSLGLTVRAESDGRMPDGALAQRRMRQRETHTSYYKSLKTSNGNMSESGKKETVKTVLQFIVSVLTALLATLGVQSCSCI